MVCCLILLAISFVVEIILRILGKKWKKKPIIVFLKMVRLIGATAAPTLLIGLSVQATYQIIKGTHEDDYINIRETQQNEPYYVQMDPAVYLESHIEDTSTSPQSPIAEDTAPESTEVTDDDALQTSNPKPSYDYSLLMFLGKYEFGEYITPEDISNMRNMYHEYLSDEKYWDMLGVASENSESIEELDRRINEFDKKANSEKTITAEEYFQNSEDRFYRYGGKAENISFLEQSAISAENAAESESVSTSDEYTSLFRYIHSAVIRFSCVLGSKDKQFADGKGVDIKYRMGKLLYKPALNLENITRSEKYYSLCSSYVVLKDAFDYSSLDSTYAVDVAYYYLLVCNDILNAMRTEQSQEIQNKVMLAYYQLLERIKEKPENFAYDHYYTEAEVIMEKLRSNIGFTQPPQK